MDLTPIINTDVKMPKKMMDALNRHEAICTVSGIKTVTVDSVLEFLQREYGAEFAAKFRPEYLFSTRET